MVALAIVCLKLYFARHDDVDNLLQKVMKMEQEAVNWLIDNGKTSLGAVHEALYYPLRKRYPKLHSQWAVSALKTASAIVHAFKKRKRKDKAEKPNLKNPFVRVNPNLAKVRWQRPFVTVTFPVKPHDLAPITVTFGLHHKYAKHMDNLAERKCKMGEIILTPTAIIIPLKYSDPAFYQPVKVMGIDSNENSLDCFDMATQTLTTIDTSVVPKICRDHDRRVQSGTYWKRNPREKRKVQRKHGQLRREKVKTLLFGLALWFVAMAGMQQAAIVLENLKGMMQSIACKCKSKRMRRRLLNWWAIMTFHRILESKARQYGVPIVFINPAGTSKTCLECGVYLRGRDAVCPSCGLSRHYVAAINITHRGLEALKFPAGGGNWGWGGRGR